MPTAVIETLLEVAPIFQDFTAKDRSDLLEFAVEEKYAPGLVLISAGETAHSMFVLAEGTVEVIEPSDFQETPSLATLIPPCSFGEVDFFEKSTHAVTIRTLTAVHLLSIERVGFDRLLARQSLAAYKLALNVLLKLGDQMRRVEEWVAQELAHSRGVTHAQWNEFRTKLYQGWEV